MNKKSLFKRLKIRNLLLYITIEEFYLHLRRIFYYLFKRKRMMEGIAKRKGYCNYKVCGDLCCDYFGCDKFNSKTKICGINDEKPLFCHLFPFDAKDIPRKLKFLCTFYW